MYQIMLTFLCCVLGISQATKTNIFKPLFHLVFSIISQMPTCS